MKTLKEKAFGLVREDDNATLMSRIFNISIIALVLLNVITIIWNTFPITPQFRRVFATIEVFSILVFSIEYILRLWTAVYLFPEEKPYKARIKYMLSFMAIIDLLAILPFYLFLFAPFNIKSLRALRLLRLFKLTRYTNALSRIGGVFRKKASQLLSSMIVLSILLILASVLMYGAEHKAQPEKFVNAFSGLWWAIVTVTTVGYGDIYPITVVGRILGGLVALIGVALVAVPTGIISAGFVEQMEEDREKKSLDETKEKSLDEEKSYCPYCGKKIN